MLVCPQCQFENPDSNKFCQQCGTSLTESTCPACGAAIAFELEYCPECNATAGMIWRAVLVPVAPVLSQGEQVDQVNGQESTPSANREAMAETPAATVDETSDATPAATPAATKYLGTEGRYRLLEPLPELAAFPIEADVRVLDCQPLRLSPLEMLYSQGLEVPDISKIQLGELAVEQTAEKLSIPAIARTYLELQSQLYPSLPHMHDAWEQNGQAVVLLEDRSDFLPLVDLWKEVDVEPFQILHLLHQMTELWEVLQPHGYAQSLLVLSNLKIDEDQLLYLQRLYVDTAAPPPQLTDLGGVWETLFQHQPERAVLATLVQMCSDLKTGAIATVDELEARLSTIANDLQSRTSPTALEPDWLPAVSISSDITEPLTDSSRFASFRADLSLTDGANRLEVGDLDEEMAGENDDTPTVVLPMKLISLEDAGRSDIGRQRDHNEDYFSIQTDVKRLESLSAKTLQVRGLYLLCDGMGGHAGGEVASELATDTLRKFFQANWTTQLPSEETIRTGIALANKAIYDLNQQSASSGSGRMGTTVVVVLLQDTHVAIAHVGDSRLYRYSRRRGLEQITTDHEVGQREMQRGVEEVLAYARPDAYQLTQALGPRDEQFVNPDVQGLELNEDMLLLLCSDGLTDNNLLETYAQTHLEPLMSFQTTLEYGVNQLIDLANQHNGHDNITTIALRIRVRPNLEGLKP